MQIKGPVESPYLNPDDIQQLKARALPKPVVEKQGEIEFHKAKKPCAETMSELSERYRGGEALGSQTDL